MTLMIRTRGPMSERGMSLPTKLRPYGIDGDNSNRLDDDESEQIKECDASSTTAKQMSFS